ncbi:MAG: hypothetical protein IKD74_01895 [Clostridia bacterium]|nr:hypothetical protein [Clostridia bacterium]
MNTKKPMNIVFYKTTELGKEVKKACIFYNDGTVANVNYEQGLDACEVVVKELNINSKNAFKEMLNKNIVHVVSEKELKKNFNSYIYNELVEENTIDSIISEELNSIKEEEIIDEDSRDTEILPVIKNAKEEVEEEVEVVEKKQNFFSRKLQEIRESKIVKKFTAIALAGAVGLGLYSCAQRKTREGVVTNGFLTTEISGKDNNTTKSTDETVITKDNSQYNGYSFDELMNVTTNETQRRVMSNINTTLNNYNNVFASFYKEKDKNIRAALTFEEVVALGQAYNDYSLEDLKAIFNGVYGDIDSTKLTRSYKDASLQLMGAYTIENRNCPVDMSLLIETQEGKDFYKKYHEMFLNAKEATGQDKLDKIKLLYDSVREDFPITEEIRTEGIMHSDAYDELESYKLAVTPMIAAGEMMWQNLSVDLTLENTQLDFLNDIGLCNYANDKFERIESKSVLFENDKTNPLYIQYKEAIEKNLKELGYYNIKDSERDISRLDSFQDNVNWHFDETNTNDESYFEYYTTPSTTSYTETKTWTENNGTTYTTTTTRTEKEIPEDVKQKIDNEINNQNEQNRQQAEKEAEEKRQELQEEEDKKAQEIEQQIKEEEQDLNQKIDDANKQIDKNNDSDPTNDKPVNESDFGNHNVDFDDNHSDSQGNLNDSVENITTDPTGDQTGKDLPDPNETGKEFDARVNSYQAPSSYVEEEVPVTFVDVTSEENTAQTEPAPTTPQEQVAEETTPETEITFVDSTPESYVPETEVYTVSEDETIIIEYEIPVETYETKSNEELVDEYVEALAENPSVEEENAKVLEKK